MVSEVARGMSHTPSKREPAPVKEVRHRDSDDEAQKRATKKLNETKNKMLDAIGKSSYGGVDLFEGTDPLHSGGQPGGAPTQTNFPGVSPEDPGVDISSILPMGKSSKIWERLNR